MFLKRFLKIDPYEKHLHIACFSLENSSFDYLPIILKNGEKREAQNS